MTRTVRFRVTALATAVVVVVLTVTGVTVVLLQRRVLVQSLQESLSREVDAVADRLAQGRPLEPLAPRADDDAVAQVVTPTGDPVAASDRLRDAPAIAEAPTSGGDHFVTIDGLAGDDTDYRVASRRVETPDGEVVVVHVASPLDDIHDSLRMLVASLLVALPLVATVLAGLVWWLVGRTLRPVEAIRTEVAGITGSDPGRRVTEPGTGDEIDRLAHTMNAMLDRVDDASRRQREFVADASHELRTPLTRLRTELEVDLAHPGAADLRATEASLLEEVDGLQRLVEDLLLLARGGADDPGRRTERVDLQAVVLEDAARSSVDGVAVDVGGVGSGLVLGDPAQLRRAVRNLTENAVRHAASTVRIDLTRRDDEVLLVVSDDGPGIPTPDRERVFERFTRLDDSRSGATGGAGLGLAITRDIVERHGGSVQAVDPGPAGGARLELTLPAADASL